MATNPPHEGPPPGSQPPPPATGGAYQAPPQQQQYTQQQPPYPGQHYQGQPQQGGGPGFGDRAQGFADSMERQWRTPETKPFFRTSEFLVWALTILGVLIAGAVVGGDDGDFGASTVWTLVVITSFAYIISRGISKSGSKYRDDDGGRRFG